ncbi:MAG: MATE family efflux transporter, partial [candidate division Zixibacteria bacterium]
RLLLTPIVASYGTAVVAAYGVANQVFAFGIMLLVGIGLGLSSLIGHNLGSGKVERAKKTADQSIWLGIAIMSLMAIVSWLFARTYMGLFFDNEETVRLGVEILRIWAFGYIFYAVYIMIEDIHVGVGLNTPMMIITTIHSWGFQVLPAIVVTQIFGLDYKAVWWVLACSGMITSVVCLWYYRRGRWLTVKL